MSLKDTIRSDLNKALKQGDSVTISTIRLLLAEIRNAEIAQQKPADDGKVLDVIAKEVKRRRESAEAFRQGNRNDLAAREQAELAVLRRYLPQQMSREEVEALARQVIGAVGARGPGDKGKVMAQLMPQLKGRADGKEVSEVVSQLLAAI
jgi:uncharacterized protein YqeY